MNCVYLIYEPEHYSVTNRIVPAKWVAHCKDRPYWPCGTTRREAEKAVYREYPNARITVLKGHR